MAKKAEYVIGMTILMVAMLSLSLVMVIWSKGLYRLAIGHFDLPTATGLSVPALRENYDILLRYLTRPWIDELTLPDFRLSRFGRQHFSEVRHLFVACHLLMLLSVSVSVRWLYRLQRLGQRGYLKQWIPKAVVLLLVGVGCLACDFTQAFIAFHHLLFNNQYWIFDPRVDPVILALPEGFFAWCAGLVGFYLLLQLAILYIWSSCYEVPIKVNKKHSRYP